MQKAIDNLVYNRTVIIIAHRLSTIAGAGNILVMEEDRWLRQGTHAQLLSTSWTLSGAVAGANGRARVARRRGFRVWRWGHGDVQSNVKPLTLTTGRVIFAVRRLCDAESGIGAVYAVLTAGALPTAVRWRLPVRQPCLCCPGR